MKLQVGKTDFVANTTAYPVQIPKGTKRLKMKTRDGTAWRFAMTKEAATENKERVWTVAANGSWEENSLSLSEPITVYVACGTAGKILETLFWVEEAHDVVLS